LLFGRETVFPYDHKDGDPSDTTIK
jgi:hypothetical protein